MPNLDAPARLAFWPEFPWDQGRDYDTLRQALTDAARRPTDAAWIVTLSGRILKPREIRAMIGTAQGNAASSDPSPAEGRSHRLPRALSQS
jgi:hypothetical protein